MTAVTAQILYEILRPVASINFVAHNSYTAGLKQPGHRISTGEFDPYLSLGAMIDLT